MTALRLGGDAALDDGERTWPRDALQAEVDALRDRLVAQRTRVLATLMDNGAAWVVADLAAAAPGRFSVCTEAPSDSP